MRSNVHRAINRQKSIQMMMAILGLVCLFFSLIPVVAAESEGNSVTDGQDLYQKLRSGKRLQVEKSYTVPEQPTVYLTFDDGPSKLTSQVLDILQKEDVKATFFALGEEAKAHPTLIKRIVEEGHTLGNHSYNHVYKELYSDFQTFWDQIQSTEEIFASIAGVRPQLVRAPGGTYTNFDAYYYYLLDQAGYTTVDWNVDSGDSKRQNVPVNEIVQTVKNTPLEHEMTILFHDGSGHASSVEALPEIIRYYKKLGYAFAPLTTEVKPKQFAVGKPKWSRNMSLSHFQELLKQTQQYATAHRGTGEQQSDSLQNLVQMSRVAREESARMPAAPPQVPLQLHIKGGLDFTLDASEYQLHKERIELPLRLLVEKMGGHVNWQPETKTADAHYGVHDVEYDLSSRSIRLYVLGHKVAAYSLADMDLQQGNIIVPLRKTIDLFGGRITGTIMEPGRREVFLVFSQLYLLQENNGLLKNSLLAMNDSCLK
ncbi:polysaccharide deacetylase [Paenibacillus sp. N3.4]|uniref:polysaccharide deacetylase n=1 Tax=Paenibacillus sp. N3.4 TaxID=2603222 RepID=UPI0011CC8FF8|nr:polysaccharide deacetylase [Paenibacillus sp. N3.4]TXK75393.1 polysaccharide deacetylase family protein [Paenibacillus sp. N3.4]